MSPFVAVFMAVWLGWVGLAAVTVWSSILADVAERGLHALDGQWRPAGILLVMLAVGVGMLVLGRAIAARERAYIVDLLARTLEARPRETAPPA